MTRLLFCLLLLGSAALPAGARAIYAEQIPAAPNACQTCHQGEVDGLRNAFGLDVETTLLSDGVVDWTEVYNVDSDGDGQTNGAELGDPCGAWVSGPTLRPYDLTDPADEHHTTVSGAAGCPEGFTPPETADPRPYEVLGLIPDQQQRNTNFFNSCGGCGGGTTGTGTGTGTGTSGTILNLFIPAYGLWRLRRRKNRGA